MTSPIYADLDIRKQNLQLHWSDGFYAVPDRPAGHSRLIRLGGRQLRAQVIWEATGGLQRDVVVGLRRALYRAALVAAGAKCRLLLPPAAG